MIKSSIERPVIKLAVWTTSDVKLKENVVAELPKNTVWVAGVAEIPAVTAPEKKKRGRKAKSAK
jgi:hypothetical protein